MWQCFFPFSCSLFIFPQPFFPFLTCIRRPVLGPLHAARLYAQGKQTHWLLFFFVLKNGAICKRRVLAVFVSKLLRSVVSASLLFVLSAYKKPQNEEAFFFLRVCFFFFVFVHTVMSTEAENWKKKRKENHRDKQKSPQKRKQRWCYIEQHHSVRSSSNKQKRWNKKQKKLYHENKNKQQ